MSSKLSGLSDPSRMDLKKIDRILEKNGLKKTPLRREILRALRSAKSPLSQAEIIDLITRGGGEADRVSIYRNLLNLKEVGVLHEVDANHYVFCSHECEDHAHLLFYCQRCHKHREVKDHQSIGSFMAGLGDFKFFGDGESIFLRGVCSSCSSSRAGAS